MPNVAPGTYVLQVAIRRSVRSDERTGRRSAHAARRSGSEGVSGLTVTTTRTPPITGTVVTDSGAALPPNAAIGDRRARARERRRFHRSPSPPRRARGGAVTASACRHAGQLALTFRIDPPRGWMLKQVELDGRDITDRLLRAAQRDRPTAQGDADRSRSRVSPARCGETAARPPGAQVRALPRRRRQSGPIPSRHVAAVRADDRGAFTIDGVPPHHDYLAVALDDLEAGDDAKIRTFSRSLRERGTRLVGRLRRDGDPHARPPRALRHIA